AEMSAAFPESAAKLESYGTWRGSIEQWVAESADLRSSAILIRMRTGGRALDLYFTEPQPVGLPAGSTAEGSRIRARNTAIVTSSTALTTGAAKTLAAADKSASNQVCSTIGVQKTAVLLVTFPGLTPPVGVTPQSVYDTFFGAAGRSLDGFWREASYGKTSA